MDKRKIKNAMALIGLMGILLYGACGSEKKEIPKQIYIGVACYDQRDTFLGELLENFKRECRTLEKRGYDISLTIMDAANSQRTQDDQVQEMIGNGCDILCVNLADRTDPSQIITAAQEHDIPIIFFTYTFDAFSSKSMSVFIRFGRDKLSTRVREWVHTAGIDNRD